MLLINNRKDFRDYIQRLMDLTLAQQQNATREKDRQFARGTLHGFQQVLEGLNDWDKCQPVTEED